MSAPLADASARAEALDLSRHVLTVAPAGSGKTGLLVQRLLAALAAVETPEQVVAMTFTNKAAAEIRARTLELLHRAAAGEAPGNPHEALSLDLAHAALARDRARDWQLIVNPERLRATTIDGLQAQIAAELPLLSGLGGRPRVVEDARALYEEAVLALFDEIEDASAPAGLQAAAASWLRAAGNRVDRLMAPLCALLARREQWSAAADPAFDWAAQEDAVLAALHETHQRRLAQALGEHDAAELAALAREGAAESEALAWAAQLERWPQTGAEHAALHAGLATLLVTKDGSLRKANGINARLGFPPRRAATLRLKALLAAREGDEALALAAAELIALPPPRMPADLAQLRDALLVLLRRLLAQLHVAMGERGEVDFVEIGQAALRALRPDGGYGEALLKRDAQLRHLLVDEMQDTSEGQLRLLEQLTAGWQPGDGRSLFLVGDPQQSIYAFRKAEVRLFQRLWREGRLGELALQRVRLSSNFRSSAEVVDWFNRAFAAIFPARDDELAGEVAFSASVAARPPASDGLPAVSLHAYAADDSAAEARAAAQRAAGLSASGASVAILVRARPHVRQTLRELRALGVRAACQDVDPLAAVPAVRDVLALARALWHPEDRLSWAVLLRAPFVGLSWADLLALSLGRRREPWPQRLAASEAAPLSDEGRTRVARLRAALEQVQHDAERPSLAERVETLWTALGGAACCDAHALADVRRSFVLLREQARGGGLEDARGFARAVEQLYAAAGTGPVQVMTVHKAKGLEFDHVLLVGSGRKPRGEDPPLLHLVETPHGPLLVPRPPEHWDETRREPAARLFDYVHRLHRRARDSETLRLLYVAATRARRTLDVYLCADCDGDGALKPASGSFAQHLLRAVEAPPLKTTAAALEPAPPKAPAPPRAPRLPLTFVVPAEDESGFPLYRPREQRALRPSEAVLSALDDKREAETDEGDELYARLVGTLFHQAMARIAQAGLAAWTDAGTTRRASLAAGLRRLGLPEPQVEAAVTRVLDLVAAATAGDNGRRLLDVHPWARAEYALGAWREGRWVAAVIDRCFEDADGVLWLIDYKTTAQRLEPAARQRWMEQAVQRYRPQLSLYAELLRVQRPGKALRAALYFPEDDRLAELAV